MYSRVFISNVGHTVFTASEKRDWEVTEIKIISDATTNKSVLVEELLDGVHVSRTFNSGMFTDSFSFSQLNETNYTKDTIIRMTVDQSAIPATGYFDQIKVYVTVNYLEDFMDYILDEASGGLKATLSPGSAIPATAVTYDPTGTNFVSTNVQDVITEGDGLFLQHLPRSVRRSDPGRPSVRARFGQAPGRGARRPPGGQAGTAPDTLARPGTGVRGEKEVHRRPYQRLSAIFRRFLPRRGGIEAHPAGDHLLNLSPLRAGLCAEKRERDQVRLPGRRHPARQEDHRSNQ